MSDNNTPVLVGACYIDIFDHSHWKCTKYDKDNYYVSLEPTSMTVSHSVGLPYTLFRQTYVVCPVKSREQRTSYI